MKSVIHSIFKTFLLSVLVVAQMHFAYAQTASILPPAKTTFLDANGKPLTAGTVESFIPSTTTHKTTWQDAAETIPNANPLTLDAAGRALLLGSGSYRQVVKDRLNNVIWDQVTSSTGSGGSSGPTATGDGDLVGTIKPWAGMTAPNQYAFTYGQEVSRSTYSVLFTAITSTQGVFCNTGSPTLSGLSDTTNFWIGMSVEITCLAAGFSTVVSKTPTTITLAANANVTTNTNAIFFPWGRGNGTTTFNLPDFRGFTIAGNNNMGGVASANLTTTYFGVTNPNSIGAPGGNESKVLLLSNTPSGILSNNAAQSITVSATGGEQFVKGLNATTNGNYVAGASVTAAVNGNGFTSTANISANNSISVASNNTGGIAGSAVVAAGGSGYTVGSQTLTVVGGTCTTQPQFTITGAAGAITAPVLLTPGLCSVAPINPVATTGGGGTGGTLSVSYTAAPISLVQPTKTSNYIIKILPDDNSATASGVTALGGMTGSIACGTGLLCTGNTISSTAVSIVNPYVYPSTFGALCDGVTNDAVALQAMLTASAGKTIYIPPGASCVTGTTLVGPSNTTITGGGYNVSTLKGIGAANPILAFTDKSNISLTNFALEGSDSVTSWTLSSLGAINISQTVAAVSAGTNYVIKNLKFSKFNASYWVFFTVAGSTFNLTNVTIENNYIVTSVADIPTDATSTNNANVFLNMFSGSAGNGRVENVNVRNNYMEGGAFCIGLAIFGNFYKYSFQQNYLYSVGSLNTVAHCTNGLGGTNSYPILVYDFNADGNPAKDGLIQDNYIQTPYSAGIYVAGDGVTTTLAANDSNTLISGNEVVGQTLNDDLLPRAAIAINGSTNISVIGNKLYNNYGGITSIFQYTGTVNISNNDCSTNIASTAPHPVSCIYLSSAPGTTNTANYIVKNNNLDTALSGSTSKVIRITSPTGSRLSSVDITNNKIIASDIGIDFNAAFVNKTLAVTNNHFSGVAATSMLNVGSLSISAASVRDNTFDLVSSTTGTGLITTSSLAYMSGNTFLNRTAGAAFAFSGVGTTGTLSGMQFNNVATANQVVATSIGLTIPSWSGFSQDFVQNLNATGTTEIVIGWGNTASGVNWKSEVVFTGVGTGVGTWINTPSSANLRAALTDESGTGAALFAGGAIGAATATSINGSTVSPGHYSGEPSTGNAAAGEIGEYVESIVASGSATALTTGVAKDITTISLTAGDWDIRSSLYAVPAGTTSVTSVTSSISLVLNTTDITVNRFNQFASAAQVNGGVTFAVQVVPVRFSLASTTTIHLVAASGFTVSTMTAYGGISARRAR